ncbi:hypothetical protein M948_04995 [Virgibacillus sp. CM-4]|nr:hypothetical protein M948_04995 [Virgibacillus sp. CM-4]
MNINEPPTGSAKYGINIGIPTAGVTFPNSITLETVIDPDQIRMTLKIIPITLANIEHSLFSMYGRYVTTASTVACAFSLTAILLPTKINQIIIYLETSSDQTKDILKAYRSTT